jgi:hypothetical protein
LITHTTLNALKKYNKTKQPVLSVYLGSEANRAPSSEILLTEFHSLLHSGTTHENRAQFAADIDRIESFLGGHIPSSKSVALFSSGDDLWEPVNLEFYLPPELVIGDVPYLGPIDEALEKYSMYLVLLVDREKVRMFTVAQGEMVDCSEYTDDSVPPVTRATGRGRGDARSDIDVRHNELLLGKHIEKIAHKVAIFTENQNIRFVILGGHSEMFKRVAESLPIALRNKVLDKFVTDINIPLNDILRESKQIAASLSVTQ